MTATRYPVLGPLSSPTCGQGDSWKWRSAHTLSASAGHSLTRSRTRTHAVVVCLGSQGTFPTPKRRRRQRSRDAEAWASESGAVGIPGVSFTSSARPPVCSFPFGEEKPRWSPRRARQGSPRVTMSLTSVAETEATDPRGRFLTCSRHTCRLPAKGNGMASLTMCLS